VVVLQIETSLVLKSHKDEHYGDLLEVGHEERLGGGCPGSSTSVLVQEPQTFLLRREGMVRREAGNVRQAGIAPDGLPVVAQCPGDLADVLPAMMPADHFPDIHDAELVIGQIERPPQSVDENGDRGKHENGV